MKKKMKKKKKKKKKPISQFANTEPMMSFFIGMV